MSAGTATVISGAGLAVAGVRQPADLLAFAGPAATAPPDWLTGRGLRYKDRATRLALLAAGAALRDAGLADTDPPASGLDRTAVVVSTDLGNLDSVCTVAGTIAKEGVDGTSPMDLPNTSSNVTASWLAIQHHLRGPNITLCNGVAGGLDAVSWGRLLIRAGRAERVLVVGCEPDNTVVQRLLGGPPGSRFDGAAALVLEAEGPAAARGAVNRGEVAGYARRADLAGAIGAVCPPGTDPALVLGRPDEAGDGPAVIDLAAALGRCSGALGVLQAVAAIGWFDSGRTGPVLATAADADSAGALLLTGHR
ncbi:beta-ketoacyl synthase N-terminal-like domain-containing protein [Micromonospora sp. NPDC005203]|uniref:beta-ketoacyl synthase N-terminal-like domain-containing protein n=1 Tax=Micromonospora sp. NPDC005203 TaxID=3364226 RepID=UPI0036CED40D